MFYEVQQKTNWEYLCFKFISCKYKLNEGPLCSDRPWGLNPGSAETVSEPHILHNTHPECLLLGM